MSVLIVGSLAYDDIKTPYADKKELLGGSAIYSSIAASLFTKVSIVGVVGGDFKEKDIKLLKSKRIDLSGLEIINNGKTFRWGGAYAEDMNERTTLFTKLNVFEKFSPKIPVPLKDSEYVFLGNINPELQLDVIKQINNPKIVVFDTMNLWINTSLKNLLKVMKLADVILINSEEVRMLSGGEKNLLKAGEILIGKGAKRLIIKKGEYGCAMITEDSVFMIPAYPIREVKDPTGAGDVFAGGFVGYLASVDNPCEENFRKALAYGTILASFSVEDFSIERLKRLTRKEMEDRLASFRSMVQF